jgi:AMIN domain
MTSLPRIGTQLLGLWLISAVLIASPGAAQSDLPSPSPGTVAVIRSVKVIHSKEGFGIEIISDHPIAAMAQKLELPPRLVVDLPNSNFSLPRKRWAVSSDQISAVRVDQYQSTPPITRVVVDLLRPSDYHLDNANSRLVIRLRPLPGEEGSALPSVPALTPGVQPVAVPMTPGNSGAVVMAGSRMTTGSSLTAGADTAILRLQRGGEVHVCPGTTVSVTSSQNGNELMLGMSTGALEAHYSLSASADSVLTPDFRILFPGPGEFHYAVRADSHGNTCVHALLGNTASAIVSELMGDGTYQVKPTEKVVFRSGRLALIDAASSGDCGCPAPPIPVMRAAAPPAQVVPDDNLQASIHLAQPGDEDKPVPPPSSGPIPVSSEQPASHVALAITSTQGIRLPASKAGEVQVQVDAPLVFRASEQQPPPTPRLKSDGMALRSARTPAPMPATVLPPPPPRKPQPRGLFGKMKGFFSGIFK